MPVPVLDQVQELDQQIPPPCPRPQQRPNLAKRHIVKPATLRPPIPTTTFLKCHLNALSRPTSQYPTIPLRDGT
jgi:hypothetical protein